MNETANANAVHNAMQVEALYQSLDPAMRDRLYRRLRFDYVRVDVENRFCEGESNMLKSNAYNGVMNLCAERYVYEGDYDCTLDYWSNIDNLLNEVISTDDWTFTVNDGAEDELAVKFDDRYLTMMKNSDGEYEYSIFDKDYKLVDGGVISFGINIVDAIEDVLHDLKVHACDKADYDEVTEKAEKANAV